MIRKKTYDETIQFRVPGGLTEAIERAAAKELTTSSEWLRRLVVRKLQHMGALGDDKDRAVGV